jgi:hypothetical protein
VVREDPKRKGLLFAGTEREVYVSFDDGDHWQSLRLNMPATSIRDLIIKDDDLCVGTHGRGFWILDDITPLRQLTPAVAASPAFLFNPQIALRIRWDMNTDTPLPPDEPAGQNPPEGAVIDYYLGSTSGPVALEITDAQGKLIRKYSSDDPIEQIDPMLPVPKYWVRPPSGLSNAAGMHRFTWDLHYPPVPGARSDYPMQAIFKNTAPAPTSYWVLPGTYAVKLTAGGKTYVQSLVVKMDPRVKTSVIDLTQQFTLSKQCYEDILAAAKTVEEINAARKQMGNDAEKKAGELAGRSGGGRGGRGPVTGPDSFSSVSASLNNLLRLIQGADAAPTTQAAAAIADRHAALMKLNQQWAAMKK